MTEACWFPDKPRKFKFQVPGELLPQRNRQSNRGPLTPSSGLLVHTQAHTQACTLKSINNWSKKVSRFICFLPSIILLASAQLGRQNCPLSVPMICMVISSVPQLKHGAWLQPKVLSHLHSHRNGFVGEHTRLNEANVKILDSLTRLNLRRWEMLVMLSCHHDKVAVGVTC